MSKEPTRRRRKRPVALPLARVAKARARSATHAQHLQAVEGQAIGHLAAAVAGLSTAMRSVACRQALRSPHTIAPLRSAVASISAFDKLSRGEAERDEPSIGADDTREAVCLLSHVFESLVVALERIAAGTDPGSPDVLRVLVTADAQLTRVIRLVPDDAFRAAIRDTWGRDAAPTRLR